MKQKVLRTNPYRPAYAVTIGGIKASDTGDWYVQQPARVCYATPDTLIVAFMHMSYGKFYEVDRRAMRPVSMNQYKALVRTSKHTAVVIRRWKESGDLIALFPGEPATLDPAECQSYMVVGQHGTADYDLVIRKTEPAGLATNKEFYDELKRIGYHKIYEAKANDPLMRAAREVRIDLCRREMPTGVSNEATPVTERCPHCAHTHPFGPCVRDDDDGELCGCLGDGTFNKPSAREWHYG